MLQSNSQIDPIIEILRLAIHKEQEQSKEQPTNMEAEVVDDKPQNRVISETRQVK